MRTRIPSLIALALAATLAPAAAQVPVGAATQVAARRVTLEQALALFAESSLDLRIARAEAERAEALVRAAGAYPNPSIAASHEPLGDDATSYSESYVTLSQRLEWPATRSALREAAERHAQAARLRLAADSLRLAFEVKRAWLEAARAEVAVAVLERVVGVLRNGGEMASARLSEGDVSLYDVRRIDIERVRYENELAEAQLDAAAARRALALLVSPESPDTDMAPAAAPTGLPPALEVERVTAAAVARRFEIASAESDLEAARAQTSAARGRRIPDLTLSVGYKRQADGLAGGFFGVLLPIPLWDRNAGNIAAAEAGASAAGARLSLVERQVADDVRRAVEGHQSLRQRASLLSPRDLPGPTDVLGIAQVAYEEGEMELLGLLDAAEALREADLAESRLRADLWTSYSDLERAAGGFAVPANGMEEGR